MKKKNFDYMSIGEIIRDISKYRLRSKENQIYSLTLTYDAIYKQWFAGYIGRSSISVLDDLGTSGDTPEIAFVRLWHIVSDDRVNKSNKVEDAVKAYKKKIANDSAIENNESPVYIQKKNSYSDSIRKLLSSHGIPPTEDNEELLRDAVFSCFDHFGVGCLHDHCQGCKDGTCDGIHNISCPCDKCSPR